MLPAQLAWPGDLIYRDDPERAQRMLQVTLINHACVRIAIGDAVILCDPWLSGPAFNNGWDLLIKTPMDLDAVMAGVTHIWVSHEHPDHFVPKFFICLLYTSPSPRDS